MTPIYTTLNAPLASDEAQDIAEALRALKTFVATIPDDPTASPNLLATLQRAIDHCFYARSIVNNAFTSANRRAFQPTKPFRRGASPLTEAATRAADLTAVLGALDDSTLDAILAKLGAAK